MMRPHAEWAAIIGSLAVLDYLRSRGDADGDTLSEVVRDLVARTPYGKHLFTAALIAGGAAFHQHILGPTRKE